MKQYRFYCNVMTALIGMTTQTQLLAQKNSHLKEIIERTDTMHAAGSSAHTPYGTVLKKTLSNGMVVLVRSAHTVPKVSIQLWYNVGSRDERDEERGIAHLIEHMVFKGTETMLSESDINMLTHKLSGYRNAFTNVDYTGYLFNLPTRHWKEALPVMADCMQHCRFDDQMLNSEMKAVIQELKMRRDNYQISLIEAMLSMIFPEHPYHYPVIGYKQDLWSVSSQTLKDFYCNHYQPSNATLVVVGDVQANEVFEESERIFGAIENSHIPARKETYSTPDISTKSVTLYRDVQQPSVRFAFVVPGIESRQGNILDLLAWILGKGTGSRLYRTLVDELQLATTVDAFTLKMYQHDLFFITCEPKTSDSIPLIKEVIFNQIAALSVQGPTDHEMHRATKKMLMSTYELLEDIQQQAYLIGKYYQATNDENYIFNFFTKEPDQIKQELQTILQTCFRKTVMHEGIVLPLPASEKPFWAALQAESDALDTAILEARIRTTPVEPERYAATIEPRETDPFDYPKPTAYSLENGLTVLMFHNENTPKIDMTLRFKTRSHHEPHDKQGLYQFVCKMLVEGTENYPACAFSDLIGSRGASLQASADGISLSLLNDDFEFGIALLDEMVHRASFDPKEIEKVRAQLLIQLKRFWDEPTRFSSQLIKEVIYKDHPNHKNSLGGIESLNAISRDDLIDFYKRSITPQGAVLVIVGNLKDIPVTETVQKILGSWNGPAVEPLSFPVLKKTENLVIEYPIHRDQVVLSIAALSVNRLHPDYEKLIIFNTIFGGGSNCRLYGLRMQSGLFYRIEGSLTMNATEEPGFFWVNTTVSQDRLAQAEREIAHVITTVTDSITQQEFEEAKRAVLSDQINFFKSNKDIARTLLFLKQYDFDWNYYDTRAQRLQQITLQEVKDAVHRILDKTGFITLRVGRCNSEKIDK